MSDLKEDVGHHLSPPRIQSDPGQSIKSGEGANPAPAAGSPQENKKEPGPWMAEQELLPLKLPSDQFFLPDEEESVFWQKTSAGRQEKKHLLNETHAKLSVCW